MTCPFKHLWSTSEASKDVEIKSDQAHPASCPVVAAAAPAENAAILSSSISQAAPLSKCPFGFGASNPESSAAPPDHAEETAQAPPTCPLGFGSASGPKLSNLHCIVCKSLLYDCVTTNCGHQYCRVCISRFNDCPSCGADIIALESDPEAQDLVESFLSAHTGDKSIWDLTQGPSIAANSSLNTNDSPTAGENAAAVDSSKATMLLQVGLRAMTGGNLPSASYRLQQCMDELKRQLESLSASQDETKVTSAQAARLQSQMGAVGGCLGDCARALGAAEEAEMRYEESAGLLREAYTALTALAVVTGAEADGETEMELENEAESARQSLSVTLNKIGEMKHVRGDISGALAKYKEALELRTSRWETLSILNKERKEESTEEMLEALVDVAVSHVKVADALLTLEESKNRKEGSESPTEEAQHAQQHISEAQELLEKESWVEDAVKGAPGQLQRKLESLKAHLANF